ncbi:mechanosensitive ion channel family protein [Granulosicoccus antarcticus]|uniref:Small-conductance mechanosensitive channel n=1 Tax=Granulosicoccus antarcticus IMCC3135 TaxID=1192854 RepID=A0A2Z2P4J7_9GAMM|nr:mechanosensitive ion channel domain-containing protein [Granulosicoccus antarcticus]ASJ76370.1 putative MscS family protein YfkC [Granulosicoccus antarcticus IMCC3135]
MPELNTGDIKASKLINDLGDISFTQIALIIFSVWLLIFLSRQLLPILAKHGPSKLRLYFLAAVPFIRLCLLAVAVLMIIPIIFNITLQNFLVIAGAVSVAIGFAFKDLASSLIAGVVAIFERTYRPGDWVRIEDDYGEVQEVGLRAITLRTPDDDIVTIAHDRIWSNNISNSNDGQQTLMCVADFYLDANHDAAAMRVVLHDIALTSAFLDYSKPVLVILAEVPWGSHYKLKAYPFDMRDQFEFISDMTVRGKLGIREAGAKEVQAPAMIQAAAQG